MGLFSCEILISRLQEAMKLLDFLDHMDNDRTHELEALSKQRKQEYVLPISIFAHSTGASTYTGSSNAFSKKAGRKMISSPPQRAPPHGPTLCTNPNP